MDDYALVLNAGSSSLKFSVYRRSGGPWHADVRGQIDGIGSSPRLRAADGADHRGPHHEGPALDDGRRFTHRLSVGWFG